MNELIPLFDTEISGETVKTCNARKLHESLGVGKDFSTWIKDRIATYEFIEGEDFVIAENLSSPNLGSSKSRAQILIDYYLSLDMGKEIAMIENNAKGRQVRKYFIACEKRLQLSLNTPTDDVLNAAIALRETTQAHDLAQKFLEDYLKECKLKGVKPKSILSKQRAYVTYKLRCQKDEIKRLRKFVDFKISMGASIQDIREILTNNPKRLCE